MSLGELRNCSVDAARGEFVCQWDDDDWHAPERLRRQLEEVLRHASSGASASVLQHWFLRVGETFSLCRSPFWPGSLLSLRRAMPRYADLARSEDTAVAQHCRRHSRRLVHLLDETLYVYECHGELNCWGRAHFEALVAEYSVGARFTRDELVRTIGYEPVEPT
jgi:glycosyltransferase involved in cell wall biosynthesis